eukprot:1659616-Pyramimonas_sp.AAC.1
MRLLSKARCAGSDTSLRAAICSRMRPRTSLKSPPSVSRSGSFSLSAADIRNAFSMRSAWCLASA